LSHRRIFSTSFSHNLPCTRWQLQTGFDFGKHFLRQGDSRADALKGQLDVVLLSVPTDAFWLMARLANSPALNSLCIRSLLVCQSRLLFSECSEKRFFN
jgi:hypothetical protein